MPRKPENLAPPGQSPGRPKGKTTPRQARFIAEYLIDGNATRAAKAAGYAGTDRGLGSKLTKLPHIAEQIEAAQHRIARELEAAAIVTIQDVIAGLLTEARHVGPNASHGARVSAWVAIGKHLGMFGDKGDDDDLKHLSDDELRRRIEQLERETARTVSTTH